MRTRLAALGMLGLMLFGRMPAHAALEPAGDRWLQEFLAAYEATDTFRGRLGIWAKKGSQTSTMRVDMALQKPNRTALTILEAPENRGAEGTRMTWFGERHVNVRTRFFGLPVSLSVSVDDERIKDVRGNTLLDTNIVRAVEVLRHPATQLRHVGTERFLDRPMQLLEMRSPRLLRGIEREVVWLDEKTRLPFVREMYADGVLVYRVSVETFQFNATLPAGTFKLE